MQKTSFHILRIGLAITFLWIGILILKQPEAWMGYLQPWATKLLPMPIEQAMTATAILDIMIGILLLLNSFICITALIGTIHIIIVLIVSGITDITVRDIGILTAIIALLIESLPESFISNISNFKK